FRSDSPSISIRQARAFARAYFGETLRGEIPSIEELLLARYFVGFARSHVIRNLEGIDWEGHRNAMLYLQALMTESQIILLGGYGVMDPRAARTHWRYWRIFEVFLGQER